MAEANGPLEQLVTLLKPQDSPQTEALQNALTELAQWRLACGDLQDAARWQQAALAPADPAELRLALLPLLRDRADLRRALGHTDPTWLDVLRALVRGHYGKAAQLQAALLNGEPPAETHRETLLRSWLQAGHVERALELLAASPGSASDPEQVGDAATASAIAWALRRAERHQDAILWWQRCQTLDPGRSAVEEALKTLDREHTASQTEMST